MKIKRLMTVFSFIGIWESFFIDELKKFDSRLKGAK